MVTKDSGRSYHEHPGPAHHPVKITKGDEGSGAANGEIELAGYRFRGLLIAGEGTLVLTLHDDTVYTNEVPAGPFPCTGIKRVKLATTCTGITALYDQDPLQ